MSVIGEVLAGVWDHPLILLLVLLVSIALFVRRLLPHSGPNPFSADIRKKVRPLVIDLNARDAVLKQGFTRKKIPENLDAVVIGSGAGGLSAAALLAKTGQRVLVLEQHDQAGGACHTFVENGFEFDVGIHYIGEMEEGSIGRTLLDQLTDGQLQWCKLDSEYDVCVLEESPGKREVFPMKAGSRAIWRQALLDKFPDEEVAIDKYMAYLKKCRGGTTMLGMTKLLPKWLVSICYNTGLAERIWPVLHTCKKSTQEILDEITTNKKLQTVLTYNFGDYGVLPGKSSAYLHGTVTNHYINSAYYPLGGASEFPLHVVPVIERTGGRVLVRAPVSKILVENGKAVGVTVEKGGEEIDIYAKRVISNAGLSNTFSRLLPKELVQTTDEYDFLKDKVSSKPSISCVQLFVGLKGSKEELGLKAANYWIHGGLDPEALMSEFSKRSPDVLGDSDVPMLFVSFPSAKDPTYNERFPGKSACIVITLIEWEWFEAWQDGRIKKRGHEYESIKKALGDRMWKQVVRMFPQLDGKVEYFDVGTPLTHKYYLEYPKGGMYGMDHNKERFSSHKIMSNIRPKSDIPGLMMVGQDVLSCGFMSAVFSGLLCASQVLQRNVFGDLEKVTKKMRKTN